MGSTPDLIPIFTIVTLYTRFNHQLIKSLVNLFLAIQIQLCRKYWRQRAFRIQTSTTRIYRVTHKTLLHSHYQRGIGSLIMCWAFASKWKHFCQLFSHSWHWRYCFSSETLPMDTLWINKLFAASDWSACSTVLTHISRLDEAIREDRVILDM